MTKVLAMKVLMTIVLMTNVLMTNIHMSLFVMTNTIAPLVALTYDRLKLILARKAE